MSRKNSKSYGSWANMKARCDKKSYHGYARYGGRGISYCQRWRDFANFLEDMGERPDGFTLDRIDVNGNYEPSNCRWSDCKLQGRNRRNNVRYSYGEALLTAGEVSELTGEPEKRITGKMARTGSSVIPDAGLSIRPKRSFFVEIDGASVALPRACRMFGIKYETAYRRITKLGMSPSQAVSTPLIGYDCRRDKNR